MKKLKDHKGQEFRLTKERLGHILEHPEMDGMLDSIIETLISPETVTKSLTDPEARLYYKYCKYTLVGEKFLCVVVKLPNEGDAFVLTAYLTDKVKRGELIWPKK
jgi:hypothetical protein